MSTNTSIPKRGGGARNGSGRGRGRGGGRRPGRGRGNKRYNERNGNDSDNAPQNTDGVEDPNGGSHVRSLPELRDEVSHGMCCTLCIRKGCCGIFHLQLVTYISLIL
jgi:hypothetical protein